MRSPIGGNSKPNDSCSASNQAAPRPKIARPPEITSSVVTIFASSAGLRYVTPVTSVLSWTDFVSRASAASTDQPSIIGSSCCPTPGIWFRWSITVTTPKPAASAAFACSTMASNTSAGGRSGKV